MPSDQAPQAARLPDSEIAKCVQGSPVYQVTKWDRAIADAATKQERARVHQIFRDQRVRIRQQVRQEALDAAVGMVALAEHIRQAYLHEPAISIEWEEALADWNKFKEAGK